MATVAVLGTGNMGSEVARQLLDAETDLRVWDRTREKAEPLGDAGATVSDSPADAVDGAGFVITIVAEADAVEQVMTGEDGALEAMGDDAVWLQMSTVGLEIDRLAELAGERGVTLVDAPMLNMKASGDEGELLVLAAGPEDVRDRCQPVLDAIGSGTRWVGEVGAASRLKLVLTSWLLGLAEALAETTALAEALDVEPDRFLELIEGSPIGVPYAQTKGEQMMKREFVGAFPVRLAFNEARLIVDAGERNDLDLALARVVAGQLAVIVGRGYGGEDVAAVFRAVTGETDEPPQTKAEDEEAAEAESASETEEAESGQTETGQTETEETESEPSGEAGEDSTDDADSSGETA
ncbi:MAG: NAD(P)-dependent oxidoreductase, partial [Actinomycetota bacterium]|nr:NAD(P)-dependent oxidoreductase [Actinomycetota bacterium]